MIPYFLDFHENIRISKTLSEYQEQRYPIEKTTIVFLDPPKKRKRATFVEYSWNSQGIFLYSIFPRHYFEIFPRITPGIFSEYTGNFSRQFSTNTRQTYICPVGNGLVRKVTSLVKSSMLMFDMVLFLCSSLKIGN